MGRINIVIPDDIHKKAKAVAALKGITLIELINDAIAKHINSKSKIK